jgi:hypothetical protein
MCIPQKCHREPAARGHGNLLETAGIATLGLTASPAMTSTPETYAAGATDAFAKLNADLQGHVERG